MVKVKVTTTLELELKEMFLLTETAHRKGFDQALELGVRTILLELNETQHIDNEIFKYEKESLSILTKIQKLREMKLKISTIETKDFTKKTDPTVELYRLQLFEKTKSSIIKLSEKGDMNWERITASYKFENKKEAQEWFKIKIEELKKQ